MSDTADPVRIEDGLTDQQRRGAELAAAGWTGVAIAAELDVRPETVSRWKRLPAWQAVYTAIVAEARGELQASLRDLAGMALDVVEGTMAGDYDPALRLRAATEVLRLAGVGRVGQSRGSGRFGAGAASDDG